jgi:hypothetical protein
VPKKICKRGRDDLGLLSPKKRPLTKREREVVKEAEKAFGGRVEFVQKDE